MGWLSVDQRPVKDTLNTLVSKWKAVYAGYLEKQVREGGEMGDRGMEERGDMYYYMYILYYMYYAFLYTHIYKCRRIHFACEMRDGCVHMIQHTFLPDITGFEFTGAVFSRGGT